MSQAALAKAVGISQPAIRKVESGKTAKSKFIPDILTFLGLASEIRRGPAPELRGDPDLPIYAAAEGGPGEMVVTNEPIDIVVRPWYVGRVREAFGVLITGESMLPAYEPGDIAIVNPKMPSVRNKTFILATDWEEGEFRATIKRLIGWSDTAWRVEQFNPPKKFDLQKKDWPKALRVVGKYDGG